MAFLLSSVLFASLISLSAQNNLQNVLGAHPNLTSFTSQLQKLPGFFDRLEASDTLVTLLAPDNAAMAKTIYYPILGPAFQSSDPEDTRFIMQYHVLPGVHMTDTMNSTFHYYPTWLDNSTYANVTGGQRVGGVIQAGAFEQMVWTSGFSTRSVVREADVAFDGGILHIIDSLVVPPSAFPDTAESFSLAIELYGLNSFLGAIYATLNTTLESLLNTTSDITILAPNNIAMESVMPTIASLSNRSLQDLLKYHIILSGNVPLFSTGFSNGSTVTTLQGQTITFTFSSNSWFANSARILTQDLLLSNGVMHVLDNVLSPNDTSAQSNPTLATQVPVLQSVLAADLNSSVAPFTTFLPNAGETASSDLNGYVGSVTVSWSGGGTTQTSRLSGSTTHSGAASSQTGITLPWIWLLFAGMLFSMA